MNTFMSLAEKFAIGDFARLWGQLSHPDVKTYVRTVRGVARRQRGQSEIGMVTYDPVNTGKYDDKGEIPTGWLDSPVPLELCKIAKSAIGKKCRFYQLNSGVSPDNAKGFRELIWIEPLYDSIKIGAANLQ